MMTQTSADELRSLGATEAEIELVAMRDAHEERHLRDGACICGGSGHSDGLSRAALMSILRARGIQPPAGDPWAQHVALGLI